MRVSSLETPALLVLLQKWPRLAPGPFSRLGGGFREPGSAGARSLSTHPHDGLMQGREIGLVESTPPPDQPDGAGLGKQRMELGEG